MNCWPGNMPRGNQLEQDQSSSKQCEGAVLCALPWVFAKLQSGGRASAPACAPGVCLQGLSLPWGQGAEKVCSRPSARASPSWKSCQAGDPGTPPLAGGQLAVAQHRPFPAAPLLGSQWPSSPWWSVGLPEKEISMHVPVPLGPTASRPHNSPFLCAVLMPLLFLISSHYVDLTSSAFPGQK